MEWGNDESPSANLKSMRTGASWDAYAQADFPVDVLDDRDKSGVPPS